MSEQLKSKNIADILHYLLSCGPATKTDLVRGTALGNTTVSDAINDLTALELVHIVGKEDSIGGRRSTIYELNREYGCFIGVAFCEGGIDFVTTGCHNDIKKQWTVRDSANASAISVLINELRETVKSERNVLGIGIGLHGEIDYESQVVTYSQNPSWQYVHLKEIVERELLVLTAIDHFANGALLKEKILGAAKGISNLIYYTAFAPQKAAILLDNQICRGKNNMAGRIASTGNLPDILLSMQECLDAPQVIVASDTAKLEGINSAQIKASRYDLARGMAISAQSKWFNHAPGRKERGK